MQRKKEEEKVHGQSLQCRFDVDELRRFKILALNSNTTTGDILRSFVKKLLAQHEEKKSE